MKDLYFIYDQNADAYLSKSGLMWTANPHEARQIEEHETYGYTNLYRNRTLKFLLVTDWWNYSISHATHRSQDLIPAFLTALRERDVAQFHDFAESWDTLFDQANNFIPESWTEDDDDWWDSSDAGEFLESLFDALNNLCPSGIVFGAHEGDGSDFGFWAPDSDEEGEA